MIPAASWLSRWAGLTAIAAITATLLDSALLQRRYSYFTGGFLSVDHLKSGLQTAAFLIGSVLADGAVVGLLIAVALWLLARTKLNVQAGNALVLAVGLAPIVIADFISYRLHTYLGDAFDLALMFDLAGRDAAELFAVSSSQIITGVSLLVGAGLAVGAVVWVLHRLSSPAPVVRKPTVRAVVSVCAAALVIGVSTTTALRVGSDELDNGLRRKPAGRILGSVVHMATDVDRDGYGLLRLPADPDLFNADIFPYAVDIPGNGIDENGVGGDLPLGREYTEKPTTIGKWQFRPDVLLFVLESVRADSIGASHKGKAVTPTIDALAGKGVSVRYAYSHNGYTAQSRHHILAGSLAGLRVGTLLDDFKANGYEVAYFSAQDESFGNMPIDFSNVDVFFDARSAPEERYSTFTTAGSLAVPIAVLRERISSFLRRRSSDHPLFLYVNFHDTHFPYHHDGLEPLVSQTVLGRSDISPSRAVELRSMYLNTVANVDRAIGDVLHDVRKSTGKPPAVIVLADHGESLFDEGFLGHGYALNDAQTRIPLVVTGLELELDEPFGQASLRDAIGAALERSSGGGRTPTIVDRSEAVFQYLGNIARPRQIAFVGVAGRTTYDFRTGWVRFASGAWLHPENLSSNQMNRFLDLVHTWERMMLARGRRHLSES